MKNAKRLAEKGFYERIQNEVGHHKSTDDLKAEGAAEAIKYVRAPSPVSRPTPPGATGADLHSLRREALERRSLPARARAHAIAGGWRGGCSRPGVPALAHCW